MNSTRIQLTGDGRSGPKTEAMIADFQKVVLGTPQPDGKVDPNGRCV